MAATMSEMGIAAHFGIPLSSFRRLLEESHHKINAGRKLVRIKGDSNAKGRSETAPSQPTNAA